MAFVAEAALIALREGLEAFLIVGILAGLVTKLDRPDARRWVWAGFAVAVVVSVGAGILVQTLVSNFEEAGYGERFELVAALAAVLVLSYMVFWMWQHTRTLMAGLKAKVKAALTQNTLWVIAFLTFASVLREGLEVVLFYAALGADNTALDLAWSGLVGVAVSVGLVLVILKTTIRLDLQRFFAVTGVLLVFIAAGLLVHSVHAAQELGLLPASGTALWDTSGAIPNDSAAGRILHALFGYEAAPNLLQAILYFSYLFAVGITYLWQLGVFHRPADGGLRKGAVAAVAVLLLLAGTATAYGAANPVPAAHGHDDEAAEGVQRMDVDALPPHVGVLLRVHGEPIHYNASTYASFRGFYEGLLKGTGLEPLLAADQGTMLIDRDDPFCTRGATGPSPAVPPALPALHDAWTRPFALPAAPVADPTGDFEGCLYGSPGGPGLGEPDLLEIMGLATWRQWIKMDGTSPMHDTQAPYREAVRAALQAALGDRVTVELAFHIQPKVTAGEGEADAARRLVDAGVDVVVDAYGSGLHSDVMNGCMMAPHAAHALRAAGHEGPILSAAAPGLQAQWAEAVAAEVDRLASRHGPEDKVALLLTHHGLALDSDPVCHDGPDAYHEQAGTMFANAVAAIEARGLKDRFLLIEQVYGQGATEAGDPAGRVSSPTEAFDKAQAAGATHIIDLPYELTGNGFDNLVGHRESWGFAHEDAPYYTADHTTTFVRAGTEVHIAGSAFGQALRGAAWADSILDALHAAYGDGGAPAGDDHGH